MAGGLSRDTVVVPIAAITRNDFRAEVVWSALRAMQRPVALPITHTHGLWFSLVADYLVRGTVLPIAFESPLDRPLPPVAGAFGWDTRKALELAEGVAEVHFVPFPVRGP